MGERTLHVLDVENLAGTGHLTDVLVAELAAAYTTTVRVGETDHVVLGCAHHNAAAVFFTWPTPARGVMRSGPDGADLALLDVLDENIPARYTHVIIGSGDHLFTPAIRRLRHAGVRVDVVTGRGLPAESVRGTGRVARVPLPALALAA